MEESYDAKRARVLKYARTVIDPPVEKQKPEEEMVDVGGIKMPVSYLEKLRDAMSESKITTKPEPPTRTTIQIPFPPPFDDGGEESVRYVTDDALARKMKKCFGG